MSGWDVLDKMASSLPPIVALVLVVAVVIIFIIGFSKHGLDFIKHGFKQTALDETLESRFDELKANINGIRTEIDTIRDNHFRHLKNYLGVLNGVLLDKQIIDNETKARLDNELRGM